jgi:hypothetical protein
MVIAGLAEFVLGNSMLNGCLSVVYNPTILTII